MNSTFQFLLEEISSDILSWLIRDRGLSIEEALTKWYNSETYKKVSEQATGMYIESPAYNYEFLKRELNTGHFQA